jgi:hypothetical protein
MTPKLVSLDQQFRLWLAQADHWSRLGHHEHYMDALARADQLAEEFRLEAALGH